MTTWKDRKQVMFVHTHLVGNSVADTEVERHVKGRRERVKISCPAVVRDYSLNMNGVDKSDRDGRDNSVTIRSNRWYLRIWFWTMERVIHCVYVVVCYCANDGIRDDWKQYTDKNDGTRNFHIDLGLLLMEFGIKYDWDDLNDLSKKPDWMRKKNFVPCNCRFCFFCKNGYTNGIFHDRSQILMTSPSSGKKRKKNVVCTRDRFVLADFFPNSRYCAQCYIAQPNHLGTQEKKKNCRQSYKGCPSCNEPLCEECWKVYDNDRHRP